jgi:hypothetical protein
MFTTLHLPAHVSAGLVLVQGFDSLLIQVSSCMPGFSNPFHREIWRSWPNKKRLTSHSQCYEHFLFGWSLVMHDDHLERNSVLYYALELILSSLTLLTTASMGGLCTQ